MPPKKKGVTAVKNACWVWDITINNPVDTPRELQDKLAKCCKHWVFQKERGAQGTVHYQIRISLKEKQRGAQVSSHLQSFDILKASLSVTSLKTVKVEEGKNIAIKFDYCMKTDTRVEGPWSDRDMILDEPREIKGRVKKEWQQQLYDEIKSQLDGNEKAWWFDRRVWIIVDPSGGSGKTTFQKFVQWDKLGIMIPAFDKPEDTMSACLELKDHKCFMVNLPRGYSEKDEKTFWAGMESLKDGYLYDKRFKFRHALISSPIVYVFSNRVPKGEMSADRFHIRLVHEDKLYKYSRGRYDALVKLVEDTKKIAQKENEETLDDVFDISAMRKRRKLE